MPTWVNQSGVLPVLNGRLCMVTSSSGKRWVFPKGLIDPGHTAGQAALTEAWEEAGLVGTLDQEPAGNYVYEKLGTPHHVLVYVMRVIEARDTWPERGLREREWLTIDDALDRVEEPGLRELIRRVFRAGHPDRITLVTA
ncbi:NUDIX hydrolase [Gemmata sp.]|uniref:NUDIX hydrolase n=1 Tax=Gemmata sp. TaxID=1914242 RepID=UPI003F6EDD9C